MIQGIITFFTLLPIFSLFSHYWLQGDGIAAAGGSFHFEFGLGAHFLLGDFVGLGVGGIVGVGGIGISRMPSSA